MKFSFQFEPKLAVIRWMSTLLVLISVFLSPASAHEVRPAIADMVMEEQTILFEIDLNIEGILSGIDLSSVNDTNDAENAADYDALRGLSALDLEAKAQEAWPDIAEKILIMVNGTELEPNLVHVAVAEIGNVDLPRDSKLTFSTLRPSNGAVTFQWDRSFGTIVLRQQGVENPYTGYLEAGAASDPIPLTGGGGVGGWQSLVDYIPVGFDHIVPKGLDHILFVLGLFFLAARFRPLLWQVSAFTLAHTITLALAALNIVNVPGSIVEPLIAASIVYVAIENVFSDGLNKWRPVVIFGFGLLHGLGFASVLGEFGLPEGAFIPALIGFNLGVEVGQLFVIAIMFASVFLALRATRRTVNPQHAKRIYAVLFLLAVVLSIVPFDGLTTILENPQWIFFAPLAGVFALCFVSIHAGATPASYRRFVSVPASLFIAAIGAWWVIERVFL